MNPGDIPVDSNELIALCAPRLTFISYGIPEKGDARWLDHQGSFMATVDASRVFVLLGAKGIVVDRIIAAAKMPPVNQGLLDGQLAWRQHDGGHIDAPNMKWFIEWANKIHRSPIAMMAGGRATLGIIEYHRRTMKNMRKWTIVPAAYLPPPPSPVANPQSL